MYNKGILIFIGPFLINTFVYTQEIVYLKVTDTGVRLRETTGVTGKIIRNLDLNEIVEYIESKYTDYTDEYKWVNIKTNSGIGWAYGEYLDFIKETQNNQFDFIENIEIRTAKGFIFPGLTKEKIIEILGEPIKTSDFGHGYSLYYGNNADLRIDFYKYNNRINHIVIKSPDYVLRNSAKVGLNIRDFSNNKQPCPKGTGYVVLIRCLYSWFNTFFKRPKGQGIKPLNTNNFQYPHAQHGCLAELLLWVSDVV